MRRRYAVKYFIVWPPPHPGRKVRQDRRMWYWNASAKSWETDRTNGATSYDTRDEAELMALVAAATRAGLAPGLEALGKVRTSRQLVRLVQIEMSER